MTPNILSLSFIEANAAFPSEFANAGKVYLDILTSNKTDDNHDGKWYYFKGAL